MKQCPYCGSPVASNRAKYCSRECGEIARFARKPMVLTNEHPRNLWKPIVALRHGDEFAFSVTICGFMQRKTDTDTDDIQRFATTEKETEAACYG